MRTSRWLLLGWLLFPALTLSLNVVDQRLFRPLAPPAALIRRPAALLLAALLDECADELLGVGLQHAVDLVEEIIDALRGCRGLGVRRGRRRGGDVLVNLGVPRLRLLLLLACHCFLLHVRPFSPKGHPVAIVPRPGRPRGALFSGTGAEPEQFRQERPGLPVPGKQAAGEGFGPAQRLAGWDPLEPATAGDIEDHRVPAGP